MPGHGLVVAAGVLLILQAVSQLGLAVFLVAKYKSGVEDERFRVFLGLDWRYALPIAVWFIVGILTAFASMTVLRFRGRAFGIVMGVLGLTTALFGVFGVAAVVLLAMPAAAEAIRRADPALGAGLAPPPRWN